MNDPILPDDLPQMPGGESASFTGHEVLDPSGERLGTVADVISDSSTLEPKWLVVDMGKLKASHYVPVAGSSRRAGGDVVVPYDKEALKHAPKASRDHVLSPEDDRELRSYYQLTG
jgi:sporulation protein YlmC with PRC-barrel domain